MRETFRLLENAPAESVQFFISCKFCIIKWQHVFFLEEELKLILFFPPYQLWDWCNMFVFGCPGSEVYTRPCLDFSDFLWHYYKSIDRVVCFSQVQIKDADCHPKLFVSKFLFFSFFFFFCPLSVNAMNLLHWCSTYIHSIHFLSNLIGQNLALIVDIGSNHSLDKIRIKFQAVTY